MRAFVPVALVTLAGCVTTPPPEAAVTAAPAAALEPPPPAAPVLAYPETRREAVADEQFGVKVADPYRWLENDVRNDAAVRDWVTAQNKVTDAVLDALPLKDDFQKRITELFDYERYGLPRGRDGRFFYTRNDGLQNQSVLYVRDGLGGEGRMLIDPNKWSADGATALAEWSPSDDGRLLAYAIQDGGSDWRTVKVMEVASGTIREDELKWLKFGGSVEWDKKGNGFYYGRFPQPAAGQTFQQQSLNQRIYYHKLGTPQSADRLVYATPDHPDYGHYPTITDDGRWLVVTSSIGTDDRYEVTVIDLAKPGAKPRKLIEGFKHNYSFIGNEGTRFYFITNEGAPRLKLVAMDITKARPAAETIIAEDKATLDSVSLVGGRLFASYLTDAKSEVRVHDPRGKLLTRVALPGIGSASGFGGRHKDKETFFAFTSFNRPTTIFHYDVASGQTREWAVPPLKFNPEDFAVEQQFYASKDGTRVPMFIVRKKGTSGPAPTLLYGYGGFNISMVPSFSPSRIAWIERGGVLAVANLRGGGEYGKAWHEAGRLKNKQNVFDDFIAAGEHLVRTGVTTPRQLAIQGGSNGGLLVGAVVNQRPDLFAAANASVGVMDMLRFNRWTAGRYWVDDYGHPDREEDFKILYAYSPYHNIRGGKPYPAVLVTTADTDDRVVPGHSFKYIAALQAAEEVGDKPRLIRIETRAGHGSGKPTAKIIEEAADVYAFLAEYTGMKE